jgi:hypothetical protein
MLQTNPRDAFMSWLHHFEKVYREDVEVRTLVFRVFGSGGRVDDYLDA